MNYDQFVIDAAGRTDAGILFHYSGIFAVVSLPRAVPTGSPASLGTRRGRHIDAIGFLKTLAPWLTARHCGPFPFPLLVNSLRREERPQTHSLPAAQRSLLSSSLPLFLSPPGCLSLPCAVLCCPLSRRRWQRRTWTRSLPACSRLGHKSGRGWHTHTRPYRQTVGLWLSLARLGPALPPRD